MWPIGRVVQIGMQHFVTRGRVWTVMMHKIPSFGALSAQFSVCIVTAAKELAI
jgi:hypothetical protein